MIRPSKYSHIEEISVLEKERKLSTIDQTSAEGILTMDNGQVVLAHASLSQELFPTTLERSRGCKHELSIPGAKYTPGFVKKNTHDATK